MKKQSSQISFNQLRFSRSCLSFISNATYIFFSRSHYRGTESPIKGKIQVLWLQWGIYCSQHISLPCSLQLHMAPLPASILFIIVSFGPSEQLPVLPWPRAGVTGAITPAEARTASGVLGHIQHLSAGAIWKIDGGLYSFVCAHVPRNKARNWREHNSAGFSGTIHIPNIMLMF